MPRKIKISKYCLLPGVKFGKWTILDNVEIRKSNDKRIFVNCRCDCGTEKLILKSGLWKGDLKSCGCLSEIYLKNLPMIKQDTFTRKYSSYIRDAQKRGKTFLLSKEIFLKLTQQDCFYCGCKPKNVLKSRTKSPNFVYNGIDRIDSKKGYELNNCVSCCADCNFMKYTKSIPEFLDKCIKIYNFTNNKIQNINRVWQYYERE